MEQPTIPLILGSSSPARKAVLLKAGLVFYVIPPDIDEKAIRSDNFHELPLLIARAKAEELKKHIKYPAIVIAADQVIVCDGVLQEKPETPEQVREYFAKYAQGKPAECITGLVVFNIENGKQAEGIGFDEVFFDGLPDEVLEAYIAKGTPFQNAGGFAIEDQELWPYIRDFEKFSGKMDIVQGLPLLLLEDLIERVK